MNRQHTQPTSKAIVKVNRIAEISRAFTPVASSRKFDWDGFELERCAIPEGASTPLTNFPRHIVAILLKGDYQSTVYTSETRPKKYRFSQGKCLLYPADLTIAGSDSKQQDNLALYIQPSFLSRIAETTLAGNQNGIELVPQLMLSDAFIFDSLHHLPAEVEAGGLCGKLYAESLATALAVRLIKLYSVEQPFVRRYKDGLSKFHLRLTVEFINENLSENLSLNALAELCNLSQYHFARAFKNATGFAPHQYVLRRCVERAQILLRETNSTIAEIAFRLGFADQSHFTKLFQRQTGATPRNFREARRG